MSRSIGNEAESWALKALMARGDKLIAQNFQCRTGEIDIISHHLNALVFTEVKARKNFSYGHPSEFVDQKKQIKLIKTAKRFLQQNPIWHTYPMRFDVVCINLSTRQIDIIENAFYI